MRCLLHRQNDGGRGNPGVNHEVHVAHAAEVDVAHYDGYKILAILLVNLLGNFPLEEAVVALLVDDVEGKLMGFAYIFRAVAEANEVAFDGVFFGEIERERHNGVAAHSLAVMHSHFAREAGECAAHLLDEFRTADVLYDHVIVDGDVVRVKGHKL